VLEGAPAGGHHEQVLEPSPSSAALLMQVALSEEACVPGALSGGHGSAEQAVQGFALAPGDMVALNACAHGLHRERAATLGQLAHGQPMAAVMAAPLPACVIMEEAGDATVDSALW
jgi:hypothetical protein